MKPHPEKNFIRVCHDNEIGGEYQVMAGGVMMVRYNCPDPKCDKSFNYEIKSESELLDYRNAMINYKDNE